MTAGKPCRQCGMRKSHKMDCSEPRAVNRTGPVEGLLPNVTAAAIAASKRQITEAMNRIEANGLAVVTSPIIWFSDETEISRDGKKWVERLAPSKSSQAFSTKRNLVDALNTLEKAYGITLAAASISLSDGSEINRYGDARWEVVE